MIDNVRKKYKNMDDASADDQTFIETLKKQKIENVRQKFRKRAGKKSYEEFEDRLEEVYGDKPYNLVEDLENE